MVEQPLCDPWADILEYFIGGDLEGVIRPRSLWTALGLNVGELTPEHQRRLDSIMTGMGWKRKKLRWEGHWDSMPYPLTVYALGAERTQIVILKGERGLHVCRDMKINLEGGFTVVRDPEGKVMLTMRS